MIHPGSLFYEIFVQSFYDTNGDGIGDINGVTAKLDYLQDLGIEGIWLMPIHPSPSYHKYDVTDYFNIHPDYGTMADFKNLLTEAHQRNIKVIIDLVINHCSAYHPWFQSAIKGKNSPYRDYFIWATDEEIEALGNATREVAEDSDNIYQWNAINGQDEKYFSYFWRGMPDLNYDNPAVRQEIYEMGQFWLKEIGVDGFRLDAAKHIYPDERAPDNHAFWVEFRAAMEEVKPDVFLVGEIWDGASTIAPFLKGLKSAFNFDLSRMITDAVNAGSSQNLASNYLEINQMYRKVTEGFVDATFLKNHDQNRIRSVLQNGIAKSKIAASLLLTLPGTPFIYYGEEIGMRGRKPDEHIREPFLWGEEASDRTSWMESKYSTLKTVRSLEKQQANPRSLYNHYKQMIALRRENKALGSGGFLPLEGVHESVCAFERSYGDQTLYVYHNLSKEKQAISPTGRKIFFSTAPPQVNDQSVLLKPLSTVIYR